MTIVLTPPDINSAKHLPHLFLAGSIDMGSASNWQQNVIDHFERLESISNEEIVLLNPRRADWDSSWEQSKVDKQFNGQVSWELQGLELADAIVIWFEPGSQSPISLLELGLYAGKNSTGSLNKVIVGCPDSFWRKGNVDIVCDRYNIPVVTSFTQMLQEAEILLARNHERRMTFNKSLSMNLD